MVLWAASGLPILLAPFCQIWLHRLSASRAEDAQPLRRLSLYNNSTLLVAASFWAVHLANVEPGGKLLVSALVALPSAAVTVLLWLILAIRCRRTL